MIAPRWISDALDTFSPLVSDQNVVEMIAEALLERLPLERLHAVARETVADWSDRTELQLAADVVTDVVKTLVADMADVVTLTELYQNAARALDAAGVPYAAAIADDGDQLAMPMDLVGRIRWLAKQRPIALDLQRVEAERDQARNETERQRASANEWALRARELASMRLERISELNDQLDAANDAGSGFQRAATELEQEIEQLQGQRNDAREQLTAALEQLGKANRTIEMDREAMDNSRKLADARKRTIDEYINACSDLARQIDEANNLREALEVDILDLEGQLYEEDDPHDARDDRIAALEDEVERLEAENADLEAAADNARAESGGP